MALARIQNRLQRGERVWLLRVARDRRHRAHAPRATATSARSTSSSPLRTIRVSDAGSAGSHRGMPLWRISALAPAAAVRNAARKAGVSRAVRLPGDVDAARYPATAAGRTGRSSSRCAGRDSASWSPASTAAPSACPGWKSNDDDLDADDHDEREDAHDHRRPGAADHRLHPPRRHRRRPHPEVPAVRYWLDVAAGDHGRVGGGRRDRLVHARARRAQPLPAGRRAARLQRRRRRAGRRDRRLRSSS